MAGDFGKGDGLGVADDQDVLVEELKNLLKSLRAARDKLRSGDPASIPLRDATKKGESLLKSLNLTRSRLAKVDRLILRLARFADEKKLKKAVNRRAGRTGST